MSKLYTKLALGAGLLGTALASQAAGGSVDYSSMSTAMTAEVGLAITAGLVVAAVTLAPKIGFRVFKSFAK